MKTKFLIGIGLGAFALAIAAKDEIIMTVNGTDVPESEFEYLYNKNSQQQLSSQPIDEYVEMFKLYKLKVADAYSEGLDTLSSFRKEMEQYKHDLAIPYIIDSLFVNNLLAEEYERSKEEAEAYHIMFFKSRDGRNNKEMKAKADSVLKELRNGGDFATLAAQYSQDKRSSQSGGRMGWITTQMYPYAFETAVFTIPEGEYSGVVESPVGYHIIKGGKKRAARGKIKASHILLITKDKPDYEPVAVERIDSLFKVATAHPERFSELAVQYSDDKTSVRNGGMLPWFGAGETAEEFDSAAFSLKKGEISRPVKTLYGWHIIKKEDEKSIPSIEEMRPLFMSLIENPQDPRYKLIRDNRISKLEKHHKASLNKKTLDALNSDIEKNGLDSIFYEKWTGPAGEMQLCVIDGNGYNARPLIEQMSGTYQYDPESASRIFDSNLNSWYNNLLTEAEEARLLKEKPEYSNLYKEYVDGSLLYEVSVRKVWDRASKDEEGLKKYFEDNKEKYTWPEPKAKGYLVQTINDSISALVKQRATELGRDTLVNTIRKEFPKMVSIVKVLESKGSNSMIDNLLFDGGKGTPISPAYEDYFMIDARVINVPEEYTDVRGQVITDYQNEFQNAWEKELKSKYPVIVNEKVVKKIKKKYQK